MSLLNINSFTQGHNVVSTGLLHRPLSCPHSLHKRRDRYWHREPCFRWSSHGDPPPLLQVISTKAVLTHPQGLVGMYGEVLKFVPRHCSLLLEITTPTYRRTEPNEGECDHGPSISGFDFVVNSVWPEVVALVDEKASVIFAPGNPDSFHKVQSL